MNQKLKISKVTKVDMRLLKRLVPLHTLPETRMKKLAKMITVHELDKGDLLFREGDTDTANYYLLVGQVAMIGDGVVQEKLSAEDDVARYPLAHQVPRKFTVRAMRPSRYVKIDSRVLSKILGDNDDDYKVADLDSEENNDWMNQLLRSRVMQQIPAANIQRVMLSIEEQTVLEGDSIIEQGDKGDWYYIIANGQANVLHDSGDGQGAIKVATLNAGDAFGEEALLTNSPRNSTIVMASDGTLMRLSKSDFIELIGQPLSRSIELAEANPRVEGGESVWLDLRMPDAFEELHMPDSINLPYPFLRFQASALVANRHYIMYSDVPGQAVAAAYLLTARGLDVSVLSGGMAVLPLRSAEELSLQNEVDTALQAKIEKLERQLVNANEMLDTASDQRHDAEELIQALREQLVKAQQQTQAQLSELHDEVTSLKLELEEAHHQLYEQPAPSQQMEQLKTENRELKAWKEHTLELLAQVFAKAGDNRHEKSSNVISDISFRRADDQK